MNRLRHKLSAARLARGKSEPISQRGGIFFQSAPSATGSSRSKAFEDWNPFSGSWATSRGLPTDFMPYSSTAANTPGGRLVIGRRVITSGNFVRLEGFGPNFSRIPPHPKPRLKGAAILNCCGARRKLVPAFGGNVTRLEL